MRVEINALNGAIISIETSVKIYRHMFGMAIFQRYIPRMRNSAINRSIFTEQRPKWSPKNVALYPDLPARPQTLYANYSLSTEKREGLVDLVM